MPSPSQQPPAQLSKLQPLDEPPPLPPPPAPPPVAEQLPALHEEPEPHATHVTPLVPHAAAVEGLTHVVPWQHPLQLAGPQVTDDTQVLLKHVWPAGQTWHTEPFLPQPTFVLPGSQPASPKQPVQVPLSHAPALQICPEPQVVQLDE